MREKNQSIDYVGFTFNGTHSSQLGIVRTSDGSRFNENLLPTIQDKTIQVPGGDGTYYFGSYYTQRQFNIQFAFDDLTEQEFAELKKWLGDKKIHELIFDETPYKAYQAKVTGSATMKYIPFEEGTTNRLYKGEGSVQFTAYYPYAKSKFKFLDKSDAVNEDEWKAASGLKAKNEIELSENEIASYDTLYNSLIYVYNPGDIETHFQMILKFDNNGIIPEFGLSLDGYSERKIHFDTIKNQSRIVEGKEVKDTYIRIDTKLNLIEGLDSSYNKTGNVYNKHMKAGYFFKIPKSVEAIKLQFDNMEEETEIRNYDPKIAYDFYYF